MPENDISWDEIMEVASFSPLEALNYYIFYPAQLIKDASNNNYLPINYLMKVYQSAIEYLYQKFNN